MSERKLWVVEALDENDPKQRWLPTLFIEFTRAEAREQKRHFDLNDGFRSRIRLYVPAPEQEK